MRVFVLRARKGPTTPGQVKKTIGYPDHFEVVAHTLVSALLVSKRTREDVVFHTVLESGPNAPLTITFTSSEMESLGGFDETHIAGTFEKAVKTWLQQRPESHDSVTSAPGITVRKLSFEALVRDLLKTMPVYLLDKKGVDLRKENWTGTAAFLLTDHIPMQKNTLKLLTRLGVKSLSLGPKMLFAAHCIAIIHNEFDRREI